MESPSYQDVPSFPSDSQPSEGPRPLCTTERLVGLTALALCLCAGVGLMTGKSPYGLQKAGQLRGFKDVRMLSTDFDNIVMPDDPKDDADCNQQNQIVSDEGTYCGAMKDGQRDTSGLGPDAYGKMWYTNGNRYVGSWRKGQRSGRGTNYYKGNGDRYMGEWKNDQKNGAARVVYGNGDRFEGSFKDGYRTGVGTVWYGNGDKYVGEFHHGKK